MRAEPRAPFELSVFGGASARRMRRARPVPDFDWDSLDPGAHPPALVERARLAWTFGAYLEHRTGAQFAALAAALFEAQAPVDLAAMAADVVLDEVLHTELNARLAMQLGGGAPLLADPWLPSFGPLDRDPRMRAAAFAVHTCLVGEAVSVPVLAATGRDAHPLIASVLARIARDEGPHARFGGWVLDALGPWSESERQQLRQVADVALAAIARMVARRPAEPTPTEHADVVALGWLPAAHWAQTVREAIARQVEPALAAQGLALG